MKSDEVIRASNLSKRYGDFLAVDNISFSVKRGEIFGFIMSVIITLPSVIFLGLNPDFFSLFLIIIPSLLAFSALGSLLCVMVKEIFEAQTLLNFPRFIMVFLCGVVYPISAMPEALRCIAYMMPLTYTV